MNEITVKYKDLKKLMRLIREKTPDLHDETEISFEFVMSLCFPYVLKNIQDEMKRQHAQGYADGLKVKMN